ncbi:MAG: hypothetical protein WAW11_01965 [Patescibacteria group bacterium]
MKTIKVFLPGNNNALKDEFVTDLSMLIASYSFSTEYEAVNLNHFIIEDLLPSNIGGFLISIQRNDLSNLTIMALEKKIPTIFFSERTIAGLDLVKMHFISQIKKIDNNFVIDRISCNKNEGVDRLALMISEKFSN